MMMLVIANQSQPKLSGAALKEFTHILPYLLPFAKKSNALFNKSKVRSIWIKRWDVCCSRRCYTKKPQSKRDFMEFVLCSFRFWCSTQLTQTCSVDASCKSILRNLQCVCIRVRKGVDFWAPKPTEPKHWRSLDLSGWFRTNPNPFEPTWSNRVEFLIFLIPTPSIFRFRSGTEVSRNCEHWRALSIKYISQALLGSSRLILWYGNTLKHCTANVK